jgi:hypothetical protein
MKNPFLLGLCFLLSIFAQANPTISSVPQSGNWKTTATWQLNRLPMHGDTVLIPTGKTVVVDNIQNLGTEDIYIKIYGTLLITGGKLWLGSNSTITLFTGGIISGAGSPAETLKIGATVKFEGSQSPLTGPLLANSSTGISPTGFSVFNEIALPVHFIGFNLARQDQEVLVQWATSHETDNSHFEVQRSDNGINWNTIGQVPAASTGSAIQRYTFIDRQSFAIVQYYRIRQVDIDGRFSFTAVRILKHDPVGDIRIQSTPENALYVHFSQKVNAKVTIKLLTLVGQEVSVSRFTNPVGQYLVPVTSSLKGFHIVTITDGENLISSGRVILR